MVVITGNWQFSPKKSENCPTLVFTFVGEDIQKIQILNPDIKSDITLDIPQISQIVISEMTH
jgi:hypothetical protein